MRQRGQRCFGAHELAGIDAEPQRLAASGNVVVKGKSVGNGSIYDYATIKYSSAGVLLWINRYNGLGNGDDIAQAVDVDGSGNSYVTGGAVGSGSGADFATVKYALLASTPPVIISTRLAGINLVFGGTGGSAGATYYARSSTNVAASPTDWLRLSTNTFAADDSLSVTNTVDPAKGSQFFRLQVP